MTRQYVPVFTDDRDDGGLCIFMIPYIVNTNLRIPLKIGEHLRTNDKIIGYKYKDIAVNYSSKKIKQRNAVINANKNLPVDRQLTIPPLRTMFHAFNVIVHVPLVNDNVNITVFTTGTFKIASKHSDENVAIEAARILCEEFIIIAKYETNLFVEGSLKFGDAESVIISYMSSKKTNMPLWDNSDINVVKMELKDNIKLYNKCDVDYDSTRNSLQGLLGLTPESTCKEKVLIYGIFPTTVRGQCQMKYKINCERAHPYFIKRNYKSSFICEIRSRISLTFPITKKYIKKVEINPTGMVTFMTKTVDEMYELYEEITALLTDSRKFIELKIEALGDSSDSDDDYIIRKK
jgi:hypothetical protein